MIVFVAICPHPPIIIPKIGQENLGQVQKTISALGSLAEELYQAKPDSILVISPHGPIAQDRFCILGGQELYGNFAQFGDSEDEFKYKNDLDLARDIEKETQKVKIPLSIIDEDWLDHGMLVPLYYLTSGKLDNIPILGMGFSMLDLQTHFKFGQLISHISSLPSSEAELLRRTGKSQNLAIIASGDLSHRLTPDAPAGYSKKGKKFDEKLIDLLKKNKTEEILNLDPILIEEAGECGLRSIVILLGVLSQLSTVKCQVLSYEGPFGVGYLVANFEI
jgi:aromatic ring-opening dioxygenase LigB subunit